MLNCLQLLRRDRQDDGLRFLRIEIKISKHVIYCAVVEGDRVDNHHGRASREAFDYAIYGRLVGRRFHLLHKVHGHPVEAVGLPELAVDCLPHVLHQIDNCLVGSERTPRHPVSAYRDLT